MDDDKYSTYMYIVYMYVLVCRLLLLLLHFPSLTDMYVDQHWLRDVARSDVAKILPLLYHPDHNDNIHIELFHIKKQCTSW